MKIVSDKTTASGPAIGVIRLPHSDGLALPSYETAGAAGHLSARSILKEFGIVGDAGVLEKLRRNRLNGCGNVAQRRVDSSQT